MDRLSIRLVLGVGVIAAALFSPAFGPGQKAGLSAGRALAEPAATDEKEAFEAAKELGTADAWNAFLANYSTGFRADLARAYLKKLSGGTQAAAPPPDDFPVVAGSWGGIVRDGPGQNYRKIDSLEEGQQVTLMARTDVVENGFPWFKITYDDDQRGYQWGGILCAAGAERPDLFKTCPPAPEKHDSARSTKRESDDTKHAKSCAKGRVLIDGKCIEKGATASYCGPGYRPQGGKCIKGYQAPAANTPLSTGQKKAVNKGCPKGQVWNSTEGCHEDD